MEWEARLLGELSAARGEEEVTHFRTQKTAALFAFLAFRAGTPHLRELLIERLWPESELEQGRMSLRTALSSLRKPFGDALVSDSVLVMLHVRTDLARYESTLRAARSDALSDDERLRKLAEAVELYDDWVLTERDRRPARAVVADARSRPRRRHRALRPRQCGLARRARGGRAQSGRLGRRADGSSGELPDALRQGGNGRGRRGARTRAPANSGRRRLRRFGEAKSSGFG